MKFPWNTSDSGRPTAEQIRMYRELTDIAAKIPSPPLHVPQQIAGGLVGSGGGGSGLINHAQYEAHRLVEKQYRELSHRYEKLEKEMAAMRAETTNFLAWLNWAHPELREAYHTCLEVAKRVDAANNVGQGDEAAAQQGTMMHGTSIHSIIAVTA